MQIVPSKESRISLSNYLLLIPIILLSVIGIVTLLSTTVVPSGGFGDIQIVSKQILFVSIGIVLYLLIAKLDLSYLKHWQFLLVIYIATLALLIATLLFAPTINNVKRWLVIGGFQLQASEIAKLTVVLVTATILSKKDKYNEWLLLFLSFILALPFVILIYLQPNGSMALLTMALWFLVSFLGLNNPFRNTVSVGIILLITSGFLISSITGNNLWLLLLIPAVFFAIFAYYARNSWKIFVFASIILGLIIGGFSSVMWSSILRDYQKDRIVVFFNPEGTEKDLGFNVNQSRIAIGSGQIIGKGFGNGTQSKRNFLPEHQTDFIFASYAEEFGLVGSLFLMILYAILILVCFLLGLEVGINQHLSLIVVGIGLQLLLQVFINIGTNLGTIPATGIPLPLMSAGGSSVIMTFAAFGLIQNVLNNVSKDISSKKEGILDVYDI